MSEPESAVPMTFNDLALTDPLLRALQDVGYENPSPIQAETIPPLLAGRDVLGQAQTGTGKTAAFALPVLSKIDVRSRAVQSLVLAPTRELAIQVAEAFQKYAAHLPGFHVLPIYGGQSYQPQLNSLKRGAHVVVGTPGRVMDHLKRGTLDLANVKFVVLDEADEMLNMGFLEDVEWILQQMPKQRQVALFSATMPSQVKRIAQTYLNDPVEILIKSKTTTAANIRQRYWQVSGLHKLDALTRMLEVETFDGMIIFARTKISTEELSSKLEARGFRCAPLNGDVPQQQRERTVQRLRDGQLDILVATDVAARGLNVERITHVVNYDIPLDIESYVHRIGRTGRAGRSGEAILFVAPRERRMLASIERATRQPIERMELPTVDAVNNQRIQKFKQRITDQIEAGELELYRDVIAQYEQEHNIQAIDIAAALAKMAQGRSPLLLKPQREREDRGSQPRYDRSDSREVSGSEELPVRHEFKKADRQQASGRKEKQRERAERFGAQEERKESRFAEQRDSSRRSSHESNDVDKETYRVAVGHDHDVKPGNIVGAIANEAGIDSKYIGRIQIFDNYSLVDLPTGMPREVLQHLKKVWVAGQELRISLQRPGSSAREHDEDSGGHAKRKRVFRDSDSSRRAPSRPSRRDDKRTTFESKKPRKR
jgi:ATP-dependent RNA helicase DeaD